MVVKAIIGTNRLRLVLQIMLGLLYLLLFLCSVPFMIVFIPRLFFLISLPVSIAALSKKQPLFSHYFVASLLLTIQTISQFNLISLHTCRC